MLLISNTGRAQPASPRPVRCEDQEGCLQLATTARRYELAGQAEEALTHYQKAFVSFGDPRLLFFVGNAQMKLVRFELAARAYREYLRTQTEPQDSTMVKRAQAQLRDAESATAPPAMPSPPAPSVEASSRPSAPQDVAHAPLPEQKVRRHSADRPRLAWRIGVGVSLGVLSAASLATALALNVLNGKPTGGICSSPGSLSSACTANYVPLFASGYAVSGAALLGTILTFSLR